MSKQVVTPSAVTAAPATDSLTLRCGDTLFVRRDRLRCGCPNGDMVDLRTTRGRSLRVEGLTRAAADSIVCAWVSRHRPCPVEWVGTSKLYAADTCAAVDRAAAEAMMGLREQAATAADSTTLTWTAPAYGTRGCGPDTSAVLRDPLRCDVLRLRGQAPSWYRGAEADGAAWARVRLETTPDTVARLWTLPGAACSVRVAQGEYVVVARNAAGVSCWSPVKGGVR